MLFDTHAHLDQPEFDADRAEVVARAAQLRVAEILTVGTTASASRKCVELAAEYPGVHAAVGIQPNYVHEAQPGDWDQIVALVDQAKVVALGETGLDRYWDFAPFELQQDYFDRHLRLSQQRRIPFVVHMRDCDDDILAMLREAGARGALQGVMHSFTGSIQMAAECVDLGLYVSFAGMVTYKKSDALREVAATIPADRILVETDSPYLSPEPIRSVRRNEPAHLAHTAACLAQLRGVSLGEFSRATTENAHRLFQLR
jgi:TatD DNase family protein